MDFPPVDKPTEFDVTFSVEGTVHIRIQAETEAEAIAEAQELADDDEFGTELDDVTHVGKPRAWKAPTMYRVLRDGQSMQVSRTLDRDMPREADEHGF